jgi:hypothetical protein
MRTDYVKQDFCIKIICSIEVIYIITLLFLYKIVCDFNTQGINNKINTLIYFFVI